MRKETNFQNLFMPSYAHTHTHTHTITKLNLLKLTLSSLKYTL